MRIHPAHTMPFNELVAGLAAAREQRLVYERFSPDGLALYVYSTHCVFESAWSPITLSARGLILDHEARKIVATPFPKFFNAGEREGPVPDLPFDTTEKLDGSLIIVFHHRGRWRTATKGAFDSEQAVWAHQRLIAQDLSPLRPGVTYLAEATYPENKIVVQHTEAALRMLSAYDETGLELPWHEVVATSNALGLGTARRLHFVSVSELIGVARSLPRSEEGFVLRFANGLRLKIKGDEYKRIHALISGLTPLAMWEAMAARTDMQSIRRDLPEEFWGDFDSIVANLEAQLTALVDRVAETARGVAALTDKEIGLRLKSFDEKVRPFIFDYRKSGGDLLGGRAREKLFRLIRPTGNVLPGYVASFAVNRVLEETG